MHKHLLTAAASLALVVALTGCATKGTVEPVVAAGSGADAAGEAVQGTRVVATGAGYSGAVDPLALRMPAQVMRIWIAPWEDSRGDLHAPGYLYTEIEPRRWTLGAPAPEDRAALIRPLQIERREVPNSTRSGRDTGMTHKPGRTKEPDNRANLLGS
jgi:hypothetical protein